jgi:hypothetical protein
MLVATVLRRWSTSRGGSRRKVMVVVAISVALVLSTELASSPADAHSGGTDRYGCHAGSKPYHCHGGSPAPTTTSPPAPTTTSPPPPTSPPVTTPPGVPGVSGFGDVPNGRFYTKPVQWMVDNNITTGTSSTCFSPDSAVTRGQAAAFMWRMEGEPSASAHSFIDVTAPYQQQPVSWMVAAGITTGTSPRTFSPDEPLTRGQLAALLHRLAGSPAATGSSFPDVVKGWQKAPVAWMVGEGVTTGTSARTFSPDDPVTRGQIAAFFHRYKGGPSVSLDLRYATCR